MPAMLFQVSLRCMTLQLMRSSLTFSIYSFPYVHLDRSDHDQE